MYADGMTTPSKGILPLLKTTVSSFFADHALTLAASLSYYAIFSVTPLLLIVLALVGRIFGASAAKDALLSRIGQVAGDKTSELLADLMDHASSGDHGILGTIVGIVLLLVGATGLFGNLKDSLNQVWNVRPKPGATLKWLIRTRITGFLLVMVMAAAMVVLLGASTFISGAADTLSSRIEIPEVIIHGVDLLVSFAITAALLAVMYKFLPDAIIGWKECWVGAGLTALLLTLGKIGLGLYLGKSNMGDSYGAAGSMVITLVWIYYTSAILLFGAELTQCYAAMYGKAITPAKWAEAIDDGDSKPGKTVAVEPSGPSAGQTKH